MFLLWLDSFIPCIILLLKYVSLETDIQNRYFLSLCQPFVNHVESAGHQAFVVGGHRGFWRNKFVYSLLFKKNHRSTWKILFVFYLYIDIFSNKKKKKIFLTLNKFFFHIFCNIFIIAANLPPSQSLMALMQYFHVSHTVKQILF